MKNKILLNKNNFCDSCLHVMAERGEKVDLETYNKDSIQDFCMGCGQPMLRELNPFEKDLDLLESALNNKNLKVICITAPSVRVALGDEFGMKPGEFVQGKMVTALKKLGFHAVFDMNSAADFTILEEAHEFCNRLEKNENLPLFTSCCPGWVNYAKKLYPNLLKNLSSAKSPQQMFGSLINKIYGDSIGVTPPDVFVVSLVPCLAKKLELHEKDINYCVGLDIDVAITTKEIANFIKYNNIDFNSLEESDFDDFFGSASGAGAIFGNTGGVMEAVLRTVNDTLSKSEQKKLDYEMVRGLDGIKRAKVKVGGREISLAVVMGLMNVPTIIEELEQDPNKYQFVEVMACEGGCIGGGGQPINPNVSRKEVLAARAKGLYAGEKRCLERKAHKNPMAKRIYDEYLGGVGSELAKKMLHREFK